MLGLFDELGPVFGHRELLVGQRAAFAGLYADGDAEVRGGAAAKDAVGGRNVRVVAADGGPDVAVAGHKIVGGIEADPAELRDERFDPGVRRGGHAAVCVACVVVQIAGNVAAGNLEACAHEREHDVREVLADASALLDGDVDGRVGGGGPRHVIEPTVEALVQFMQQHERIVAAAYFELVGKREQARRGFGELAGKQELPVVAVAHHAVELGPGVRRQERRDGKCFFHFDQAFRHDHELLVRAGNVEVVHVIAEVVAVTEDAAARRDGKLKGEAALVFVGTGVHARFHDGFADLVRVHEFCKVANGVVHGLQRVGKPANQLMRCDGRSIRTSEAYPARAAWTE